MMMATRQFEIVSRGNITAVAFMDESQVVGGYFDGDIRRWRIEDGQQLGPTMQAGNSIRSVTVSKDRQWIVSGDQGEKAIVWSAATHKKECQFTGFEGSVTAVDISGDCTKVVGGSWGTTYTVQLFGTHSGTQLLPSLSHRGIRGVKFSPDGSRFATASYDSGFRVYSTHNGTVLFDSGRQSSSNAIELVTPLVWSPDGQQLFIASKGKITCFNVSDSSSSEWSIHEIQSAVSIASNGRFIACSAGKSISLWDCVSHSQIGSIITHTTDIYCMALSPSGAYLACGTGKNITIYNLRDVLPSEYIVSSVTSAHTCESRDTRIVDGRRSDEHRKAAVRGDRKSFTS
ncbi:hypothetical protein PISMIDRAFT_159927 [Pisolithus microcarpus 441]|uniref:Uncharacterized protein n=1 Tax=Pisolithus microcarpus 441 TaxID=765257 RepID=A0A0C9Z9F7_9AGAM|nr:hypothetical protein PISMIDRAFT_159927 [Pisolithus microcarpus 441]